MCQATTNCKKESTMTITHKAVMRKIERTYGICPSCAANIGIRSKAGAVINLPNRESAFYKISRAINQRDFYNLPEVLAAQKIEKSHPFGSKERMDAYQEILNIAEKHGVLHHFEPIEEYDS